MKRFILMIGLIAVLQSTNAWNAWAQQGVDRAVPAMRGETSSAAVRPAAPAAEVAEQPKVDLVAMRNQLQLFQEYLNRNLQATFENPFVLLQDVKGTYLPQFGVVFHMEANLHPLRILSMFDFKPYTPEELRMVRDSKLERIRQIKARVSDLLLEQGTELSALPAAQNVAVVVHLFNLPNEQTDGLPSQLVIEVSRGVLGEAKARKLTAQDFRKQVTFLEF